MALKNSSPTAEEGVENSEASPLDTDAGATTAKPAPKKNGNGKANGAKPAPKPKSFRVVEETGQEPEVADDLDFDDESPLEADADAAVTQVEVERTGGGTGIGWEGNAYNGIPVSTGRVGAFPKTRDVYDRVQGIGGGGQYRFVGKRANGKPLVVYKTFPGAPKPLPSEKPSFDQGFGGFGRDPLGGGNPYEQGAYGTDPGYDTTPGVEDYGVPPGGEVPRDHYGARSRVAQLNGWLFNPALNLWQWYTDGIVTQPPRGARPPALPGAGPGAYDHGQNDEVEELKRELAEVKSGKSNDTFFERWLQMQEQSRQDERDRREREREERREQLEREREERKAQAEREREERKEALERAREDRREREKAADNAAKIAAEAAKEAARIQAEAAKAQAEAMKEVARAQAEAAKAQAEAAAKSGDRLVEILLHKSEQGDSVDKALDRAMKIAGLVGGEKSEAERILSLVPQVIDTAVPRLAEGIAMVRGSGTGNVAPPLAGGEVSPEEAAEQQKMVGVLGAILKCCASGTPPHVMPAMIVGMCEASSVDFPKVKEIIMSGGPDAFATWLDHLSQGKGLDVQTKCAAAKGLITSPSGRAWVAGVQNAFRGVAPQQVATQAPKPPTPPAAPAPKTP